MAQLSLRTVGGAALVAETGEFRLIVQEGSGHPGDVGAAMEAAAGMVRRSEPGAPTRILLVEDDHLVRDVLGAMLEEEGFSVDALAGPQHALALPEASFPAPAVLVTDVYLGPGMDGFALAEAARRRWPEIRSVLISGDANLGERSLHPTESFLPKPFSMQDLSRAICSGSIGCHQPISHQPSATMPAHSGAAMITPRPIPGAAER